MTEALGPFGYGGKIIMEIYGQRYSYKSLHLLTAVNKLSCLRVDGLTA